MNKIERKINRTVQLAKNVRLHRADGGETDPMLNQDTSIYNNPYKDQVLSAPEPMTMGQYLAQAMRKPHETNIRDFPQDFQNLAVVQGIKQLPEQIWESIKYPTMALKGELQRGIDPHTGQVTGVTESGMGPTEAGMVGAGLVSAGAMPDIAAGRVTPNVMRAGSPVETTVGAVKAPRSDLGFYSHGSETALNLPQAKGTAEQMVSMLRKAGVKPVELENAGLIDAAGNIHPDWQKYPVTREELAQQLQWNMPKVEETVLGGKEPFDAKRLEQLEKEYSSLSQHPVDDPTFGQEKYDELIRLMNIRDQSTTQSLYRSADEATKWGQWAQRSGDNVLAEKYFREAEFLNTRAEKLDLEGHGLSNPTQYSEYQLPGGENYREVLLKYAETPEEKLARAKSYVDPAAWERMTEEQRNQFLSAPDRGIFKSQHWDDPNVLAHIRMSDRVGPNGEKLLHVEEMQSDWGQKGRDEGFADPNAKKRFDAFVDDMRNRAKEIGYNNAIDQGLDTERAKKLTDRIIDALRPSELAKFLDNHAPRQADQIHENKLNHAFSTYRESSQRVPSNPYVTSTQGWTDLALKRVMKEAAEGGYDGVVFTPGTEQAKRFNLNQRVSHIAYDPNTNFFHALDNTGRPAINERVPLEKLPDYVGKDVAEKLLATEPNNLGVHSLEGQDLTLGGEGMTGYYDKIVPSRLKELMKGHDKEAKLGKIGTNQLPEMLHMPMTDKMRQSILSGQRAFNEGGRVGFADGGSPPWGFDFNQPTINFQPQQPSVPPLADLNLYKGAPLNKPPEPPQEEQKQEEDTVPAAPQRSEGTGNDGSVSTTTPYETDFAPEMGPPASAAPSPFGGLATAAGYGPGVTAANTVGGLFGGVLGTAVAGPFGGLVGGLIGRHAANAIFAKDEDEDADKSKSEDKTSNAIAGVEGGGLGPATDATPGAAEQSGKSDSNAESATGNMQDGGAITVRRYRAAGGPIKLSPSHAEAGPSKISPAQAKAGNYKKKHLNFQGLPLAIETPKGHVREKIINGKLDWRVKMPVDYGYVKGTKDNDGDASDVFVGPHKKSDKVWVIDQADHRTGKFDEHKAMLGFKHKHKALKAYKDSFSDGKAHKRIMDATKLSVQEYKDWIKHGDLKKPVSSSPFIQKALMVASKKS